MNNEMGLNVGYFFDEAVKYVIYVKLFQISSYISNLIDFIPVFLKQYNALKRSLVGPILSLSEL
jgi:hypothetical protein